MPSSATEISREEQKQFVKSCLNSETLHEGDTWFLLSSKWFNLWKEYVLYDVEGLEEVETQEELSAIDNTDLLDDTTPAAAPPTLKSNLQDEQDYVLLPASVWGKCLKW